MKAGPELAARAVFLFTSSPAAETLILKGVRNLPESVQVQFRVVFGKMVESGLARLE
jgi:hypothetical protein